MSTDEGYRYRTLNSTYNDDEDYDEGFVSCYCDSEWVDVDKGEQCSFCIQENDEG